ncbi:hypothetical protein [Jiella sp. M17.18]|uniref:hypothetical protein n=1 Tax=Jiella sp. M17.18 TaxID=3234247 RepID=UPI0034DDE801
MKTMNDNARDDAMNADPRKTGGMAGEAEAKRPPQPGDQERPMTENEELDEGLDETFPASDPVSPSRIDGPVPPKK